MTTEIELRAPRAWMVGESEDLISVRIPNAEAFIKAVLLEMEHADPEAHTCLTVDVKEAN